MRYNEANAYLTNELTGRTIHSVERKGKEITFVCSDGHAVTIQADVNGDIHYKSTGVRVQLPGFSVVGGVGTL